jgi:hypothetical protein
MSIGQSIPQGLALMAPGPELATVLSGIDVSAVSGFDVITVLRARYRQLSHEHAKFLEVVVESGVRSDSCFGRAPYPDEFAADEVRAALVLTRRAADELYWGSLDLCERLPAVHTALSEGVLDLPRARVLRDWTVNLTLEQARGICDLLVPEAGSLTTGQLIERIKRLAIAIDPAWTKRQYDEAVIGRRVLSSTNPDGTANIEARHLPMGRAAATAAHLSRLARALRRAGDPRTLDQLRADLLTALTDGSTTGLDETSLIEHIRHDAAADATEYADTHVPVGSDDPTAPQEAADPHVVAGSDDPTAPQEAADPHVVSDLDVRADADPERVPHPRAAAPAGAEIVVRARLTTLAGLDRYPGELAGTGPIHAELARDLISRMGTAQWQFAITDPDGRLLHTGLITGRPGDEARRASNRGIVEVQIRACDLDTLTVSGDAARWTPVIDDIARAYRAWLAGAVDAASTSDAVGVTDPASAAGAAGAADAASAAGAAAVTDAIGALSAAAAASPRDDPHRRTPGAALRRLLQARDGRCFFMGCRAPATNAQIDHTIRWADDGPTLEPNLGAGCTHDHRLKDHGGWRVTQPEPGHFDWTSRLGHHYYRARSPIIEPMPQPRARKMRGGYPARLPGTHSDSDPERTLAEDVQAHPGRLPRPPPVYQDPPF